MMELPYPVIFPSDIHQNYREGKNVLHIAIEHSKDQLQAVINYIRKEENGSELLERLLTEKDGSGLTPLDILEKQEISERIAKKMMIYDINYNADLPRSSIPQLYSVIYAFSAYFKIKSLNSKELSQGFRMGVCHGLVFLHNYYVAQKKEEYFFTILTLISNWKGDEESLSRPLPKHIKAPYKTFGDLLNGWFNDIAVFQVEPLKTQNIMSDITQDDLHKQYQLIGDMGIPLHIFYRQDRLHEMALYELLQDLQKIPSDFFINIIWPARFLSGNTWNTHITTIRKVDVGNGNYFWKHYDSNNTEIPIPLEDINELFTSIKEAHPLDGKNIIKIQCYFLGQKNEMRSKLDSMPRPTDEALQASIEPSKHNQFTGLHIAVIMQDINTLKKLLDAGQVDIAAKDILKRTALDIAISNGFGEGFDLLYDKMGPDYIIPTYCLEDAFRNGHEDILLKIVSKIKEDSIFVDIADLAIKNDDWPFFKELMTLRTDIPTSIYTMLLKKGHKDILIPLLLEKKEKREEVYGYLGYLARKDLTFIEKLEECEKKNRVAQEALPISSNTGEKVFSTSSPLTSASAFFQGASKDPNSTTTEEKKLLYKTQERPNR